MTDYSLAGSGTRGLVNEDDVKRIFELSEEQMEMELAKDLAWLRGFCL